MTTETTVVVQWDARSWDRIHLLIHEIAELRDEMVVSASPFASRIDAALIRFYADLELDKPERDA